MRPGPARPALPGSEEGPGRAERTLPAAASYGKLRGRSAQRANYVSAFGRGIPGKGTALCSSAVPKQRHRVRETNAALAITTPDGSDLGVGSPRWFNQQSTELLRVENPLRESDPAISPSPPCALTTSLSATSPQFLTTSRDGDRPPRRATCANASLLCLRMMIS